MDTRRIPLGLALLATGGLAGCGAEFREVRRSEATYTAGSSVRVVTANGFVRIEADPTPKGSPAAPGTVRIEAEIRAMTAERLKAVRITASRRASGGLHIQPEWPEGGRQGSEGCSFTIRVPDAQGVDARTSNGDVHVARLGGDAILRTSNGAISAIDHRGKVTARTSNAAVKASGVTGALDAETSNAPIHVTLTGEEPGPVDLRTSNGEITLWIYPGFAGSIDAETSNAAVEVRGIRGARTERPSSGAARIEVGQGGPASRLRTSNGGILVASTDK